MKALVEDLNEVNLTASISDSEKRQREPSAQQRQPLVSIIIPNFNGKDLLRECLDSIKELNYKNLEVIVVDNSSTDGSIEMVKSNYPWTKLLVTKRISMAQACNRGLASARGDIIVPMLNNDLIVERCWLDQQVLALRQKEVGAVGGKVYRYGTSVLSSAGNEIWWNVGSTESIGRNELDKGQFDSPREVDYVEFPTVRKEVNDEIGGVDEGYFHYYLDVDYCTMAREAGYKVMYIPSAVSWHHEAATLNANPLRRFYATERDSLRFLLKHSPSSLILLRLSRWALDRLLLLAGNIIRRRMDLVILQTKAYTWNIRNLAATRRSRRTC
jgi:GT2 family glycosyltransferase